MPDTAPPAVITIDMLARLARDHEACVALHGHRSTVTWGAADALRLAVHRYATSRQANHLASLQAGRDQLQREIDEIEREAGQ